MLDAYRSIFAQTFSRNGSTLYIGDNLGKITTYNVTRWSKTQEFQTQLHSILFILEYKGILIAGGIGGLVTLMLSEEGRISNGKRITSESYNTALILEDQDVLIGGGPRGILYTIDLNVFHIIKEDIDSHKGNSMNTTSSTEIFRCDSVLFNVGRSRDFLHSVRRRTCPHLGYQKPGNHQNDSALRERRA